MQLHVHVNLLGYKPGDIVKENDRYYEDFKAWAVKKSTRNGAVICTEVSENQKLNTLTLDRTIKEETAPGPTGHVESATQAGGSSVPDPGNTRWDGKERMKLVRAAKGVKEKEA